MRLPTLIARLAVTAACLLPLSSVWAFTSTGGGPLLFPKATTSVSTRLQPSQQRLSMSSSAAASVQQEKKQPGTAQLDVPWEELGFEFRPTNSFVQMKYKDGEGWSEPELIKEDEPMVKIHIGATALHYGQACFEGLKAFCHEDGSVHLFRPADNAARMQASCRRILMPEVPTEQFIQACQAVVLDNLEYVPPYGSGGALYIRPLLFGSGPRIGLQPADEYTFIVLVIPVGDYYKGGLSSPVDGLLITDYDRAAPRGVGAAKVAGNYAADMLPNMLAKQAGYPIGLYLDAATQTVVEEFSTSNFVGVKHDENLYVTPKSASVLPSITNKALMQLAADEEGMEVQEREIPLEELDEFDEVLAVGTAVVVTPVGSITNLNANANAANNSENGETAAGGAKQYRFGAKDEIGPVTRRLYDRVRAIQNGEEEDKFGWNVKVEVE